MSGPFQVEYSASQTEIQRIQYVGNQLFLRHYLVHTETSIKGLLECTLLCFVNDCKWAYGTYSRVITTSGGLESDLRGLLAHKKTTNDICIKVEEFL